MALTEEQLNELNRTLPLDPGVYLMSDVRKKVIYVGKAKSLKKRVSTYFQTSRTVGPKLRALVKNVAKVDWLVTGSEKEALILEATLIKRHRPRYNVTLRDDKSYPLLRLSIEETWPRLSLVRRPKKDAARYFGPYVSAKSARATMHLINRIFPLRKCQGPEPPPRSRPCLYHQMGQCLGPCCLEVSAKDYAKLVNQAASFLSGKADQVVRELEVEMWAAAEQEFYEEAANLRDKIKAVNKTLERQIMVSDQNLDRDVFGFSEGPTGLAAAVLFVRQGALVGNRTFFLKGVSFKGGDGLMPQTVGQEDEAFRAGVIGQAISQFYTGKTAPPDQILAPFPVEDQDLLAQWLSEVKDKRVRIIVPQRGQGKELIDRATANAEAALPVLAGSPEAMAEEGLAELGRRLNMPAAPDSLECYDISIHQGEKPVGSMVRFEEGRPVKSKYRTYNIREVEGQDDFAMLAEVLRRRFGKPVEGLEPPDLVVIDGGKGQLNAALAALREIGLIDQPVVALAKTREANDQDRLFIPNRKNHLPLGRAARFLLMRLRDEAHRRAIGAHRKSRAKQFKATALTDVPGVGQAKAKALLSRMGSLKAVREASEEQLTQVDGVSKKLARRIKDSLA